MSAFFAFGLITESLGLLCILGAIIWAHNARRLSDFRRIWALWALGGLLATVIGPLLMAARVAS